MKKLKQLDGRAHRALYWYRRRKEEGDTDGAAWAMSRMRKWVGAMYELVGGTDLLIV